MKRCFFTNQSHITTCFLESAWPDLCKPASIVSLDKLQSSFEYALKQCSGPDVADPGKEVFFDVCRHNLFDQVLRVLSTDESSSEARESEKTSGILGKCRSTRPVLL